MPKLTATLVPSWFDDGWLAVLKKSHSVTRRTEGAAAQAAQQQRLQQQQQQQAAQQAAQREQQRKKDVINNVGVALRYLDQHRGARTVEVTWRQPPIYVGQDWGGTSYRTMTYAQAVNFIVQLGQQGALIIGIRAY